MRCKLGTYVRTIHTYMSAGSSGLGVNRWVCTVGVEVTCYLTVLKCLKAVRTVSASHSTMGERGMLRRLDWELSSVWDRAGLETCRSTSLHVLCECNKKTDVNGKYAVNKTGIGDDAGS